MEYLFGVKQPSRAGGTVVISTDMLLQFGLWSDILSMERFSYPESQQLLKLWNDISTVHLILINLFV